MGLYPGWAYTGNNIFDRKLKYSMEPKPTVELHAI